MSLIAFNEITDSLRTPGVYIEADNSNANTSTGERHKLLLVGCATNSVDGIQQIYDKTEASTIAGAGSELALMAARAESAYKHVDVYMAQAKEPESGTAASIEISFVATDAQADTIHLLVCGQAVSVAVDAGTTAANIAKAVADTLKTIDALPVTATSSASKVKLTCKHKGEHGNRYHVSLRSGYGMIVPSGVSVTIPSAGFSGGAGVADITDVIAAMSDDQYHYIALAHTNSASMQKMHAEMARRYEAGMMIGGRVFAAHAASMKDIKAFADGYNTPHIAVIDGCAANTEAELAASYAADAAKTYSTDPGRGQNNHMLVGITPRKPARTWAQNESLLHSGITPIKVTRNSQVQIVRAITLYKRNSAGAPDNSYLDVATLCTFDAYRAYQDIRLTTRFADHKAADTAMQASARKGIITTTILKAELLAIYQEMIDKGWVEDFENYRTELVVGADTTTPGRFNYQDIGANFITPLHIIAGKVSPVLTQGDAS